MFDVIIVGAGPAGLFAAQEFLNSKFKVLVIEQGNLLQKRICSPKKGYCNNCVPCNILCGVGGAGGFSDGKLNLSLEIAGFLPFTVNNKEAKSVLEKIKSCFEKFDTQQNYVFPSKKQKIKWSAKKADLKGY